MLNGGYVVLNVAVSTQSCPGQPPIPAQLAFEASTYVQLAGDNRQLVVAQFAATEVDPVATHEGSESVKFVAVVPL